VITRTTIVDEDDPAVGGEIGFHLLIMSPDSFSTVPLQKHGVLDIGRSARAAIQIDDPLASRHHARLHLGDQTFIEDTGSANGTRVHGRVIRKGELVAINPGEGVTIGSAVLMVQQDRSRTGCRRLWSHAYFESRLEAECARGQGGENGFALARLSIEQQVPWTRLAPVFAPSISPAHVLAAYGPRDYELLVLEKSEGEAEELLARITAELEKLGVQARTAVARFPGHGRTVDALMARVGALVRPGSRLDGEGVPALEVGGERGVSMRRIHEMAARTAVNNINVLILGETGVGKDVLARSIHQLSPRSAKLFLALNCAGIAESLIESELFGHEKGAFTGATQTKPGLLETAEGGTVFLDEVGELPVHVQAKLLRVIETREVMRIGALKPRSIDVRFISATNRDLETDVMGGRFRRDLFYRLNGISLTIPPLQERRSEIPPLARTFVTEWCRAAGRPDLDISQEVFDILVEYSWPGNIRELKNVMERAVVLCDDDQILPEHLPLGKMTSGVPLYLDPATSTAPTRPVFVRALEPYKGGERQRMVDALEACGGNQTRAAAMLAMPRRTFVSKLDRYGFPRPMKGKLRPRQTAPGGGAAE
jgi:transcriptional regulator with AAA-type ATPase domain